MAKPKPTKYMTEQAWEDEKKRECQLVDDASKAAAGTAEAAAEAFDPEGALLTMLKAEMVLLKAEHIKAQTNDVKWVETFGLPFDQGNKARMSYWPQKSRTMPLLYRMACSLLTVPAASTSNAYPQYCWSHHVQAALFPD